MTWEELQRRKNSSEGGNDKHVFMTFAWSIDYFRSTFVLGKSLQHFSAHDLIVVVPLSMMKQHQLSLADIARAQEHVTRVVLVDDEDKNEAAHHLYHRMGQRVYLKLLAWNFVEYDKIVVVDADSFVKSNKVDLLFWGKPQSFMGVGHGIMPGSLFVVTPNLNVMHRTIESLHTHHFYRFREMGYLNVAFGAGDKNGAATQERLPYTSR